MSLDTHNIVHYVNELGDPNMAAAYLADFFKGANASAGADVLEVALQAALSRDPRALYFWACATIALFKDPDPDVRRRIARAALKRRSRWLYLVLQDEEGDVETRESYRPPPGYPTSLGQRKSLARTTDRLVLAKVLRDPDPSVVRVLLFNPKLTEQDVVQLCARRPTHPRIQIEVAATKWLLRSQPQSALVKNPHTPLGLSAAILVLVPEKIRAEVAGGLDLNPRLRDLAQTRGNPRLYS